MLRFCIKNTNSIQVQAANHQLRQKTMLQNSLIQMRLIHNTNKISGIGKRHMSTAAESKPRKMGMPMSMGFDSLEKQAQNIDQALQDAKDRIHENTRQGVGLSDKISRTVEEDKYVKMQRYNIFISKMEHLAHSEEVTQSYNQSQLLKMQNSHVSAKTPLKDVLYFYNKASIKGFDSKFISDTLDILNKTLRARGNEPRAFDDYSMHEFDSSWRMQQLTGHIKAALGEEMYFNHYYMGLSSRKLGSMGHKDTELIQKQFDKLNYLITEREQNLNRSKAPLDFEQVLYGGYKGIVPRHYVFDGFESSAEFAQHLDTLQQWQVEQNDGLTNLGVTQTKEVEDLEQHMAHLIQAANQVQDMQTNLQASFDTLRSQYFRLMESSDKYSFIKENKYIFYDLLQLQELMVNSGYLTPEEATKIDSTQTHEERMKRASHIFYEYCQNFAPDLQSEQYFDFFQGAQDSRDSRSLPPPNAVNYEEKHDKIQLGSLSQSLIGLSAQALSYRKDAMQKDFLHQFYEDHATKGILKDKNTELYKISHNWEPYNVRMKQDYLKGYHIFEKEVETIVPRFKALVDNSTEDIEGQCHALAALSAINHDAPETRQKLFSNLSRLISEGEQEFRNEATVDGLYGIAMQGYQDDQSRGVAAQLMARLDSVSLTWDEFTFDQKLDTLWSACALELEQSAIVKEFFIDLNLMNFKNTQNDLTFVQYQKIQDFMVYITKVSPLKDEIWVQNTTNEAFNLILQNPQFSFQRFDEAMCQFDPFKKRVLEGLSKGLAMASIDHHTVLNETLSHNSMQNQFYDEEQMPFTPDMILGIDGRKVLLNVLSAQDSMKDTMRGNGQQLMRQRINKSMSKKDIETVCIPISSVVSFDIPDLKISMNEKFDFIKELKNQMIGDTQQIRINFDSLSEFGSKFSKYAANYIESLILESDKRRVDLVFRQINRLFEIKNNTLKQFEKSIQQKGLDTLKYELMKLNLYYENLPEHQKKFMSQYLPENCDSFEQMIRDCRKSISMQIHKNEENEDKLKINQTWRGIRQAVELPQGQEANEDLSLKKNIAPELLNQRFLWVDDYFHYDDWEQNMKEVYDSFNLLVVPRKEGDYKFFFDRQNNMRIVPRGIFPPPGSKRELQTPSIQDNLSNTHTNSGDIINQFEKEPFKIMVKNEINRSKGLNKMNHDTEMIANLQNIKQGLKRDYSDPQLMDLLFKNLSLTDKLIEEHLVGDKQKNMRKEPSLVPRDPACYREFVKQTYQSKDQEDPFSHFYIKESGKIERVHRVKEQEMAKYEKFVKNTESVDAADKTKKHIIQTMQDKMDDMLQQNYHENEDFTSLSHHLNSEVNITYNLKSLMKSDQVYDVDPELIDSEVTDAKFLFNQRRRAETKLIKSKIIYKIHQDEELSVSEMKYTKAWMAELNMNKTLNITNHRDAMLRKNYSYSSISDLSSEDVFALNQIPNVKLQKNQSEYALNDLVLELSHFIDEETVNRVEIQMLSDRVKKEWNLPEDFNIIETRNKEIGMVLNEMEELAWRSTGTFDENEREGLTEMLSTDRNKDYFDKQFYDLDLLSLNEFIDHVNRYDDRIPLLEEWIYRKEKEIQTRMVLPSKGLQKSDMSLHKVVDKDLKRGREKIVAQLLSKDQFGNETEKKQYKDLTTNDLARITEAVCVRLHMFNGNYPAFMSHTVQAILEHPNISRVEFDKLDTFSRMFELDWRGDRSTKNKQQFLATNPIYLNHFEKSNTVGYGVMDKDTVTEHLRKACTPFVGEIASKMREINSHQPLDIVTENVAVKDLEKKKE